jgi:hypothetical protein
MGGVYVTINLMTVLLPDFLRGVSFAVGKGFLNGAILALRVAFLVRLKAALAPTVTEIFCEDLVVKGYSECTINLCG